MLASLTKLTVCPLWIITVSFAPGTPFGDHVDALSQVPEDNDTYFICPKVTWKNVKKIKNKIPLTQTLLLE
jgi:hypothetical protein